MATHFTASFDLAQVGYFSNSCSVTFFVFQFRLANEFGIWLGRVPTPVYSVRGPLPTAGESKGSVQKHVKSARTYVSHVFKHLP